MTNNFDNENYHKNMLQERASNGTEIRGSDGELIILPNSPYEIVKAVNNFKDLLNCLKQLVYDDNGKERLIGSETSTFRDYAKAMIAKAEK